MKTYPDDASGRVLRGMAKSGVEISAKYDIDFEHIFADLSGAEAFEQKVKELGFQTKLREYEGRSGFYWEVQVVVRMVPTYEGVTRMEAELDRIADSYGGMANGWGVLI